MSNKSNNRKSPRGGSLPINNQATSNAKRDMIERDPQEVIDAFRFNVSMLEHLCEEFDKGMIEAALWIAVVLRTLLFTNKKNKNGGTSIMDQLKSRYSDYDIDYISTALPKPQKGGFIQGWTFGDNIHNMNFTGLNIYVGLAEKCLRVGGNGELVADIKYKGARDLSAHHYLSLDEWLDEVIFCDYKGENSVEYTRIKAIKEVADKDGGAHFDPKIPKEYDTFRHPEHARIIYPGGMFTYSCNPVYVSIRQIAWEVLESFKENGLIKQ